MSKIIRVRENVQTTMHGIRYTIDGKAVSLRMDRDLSGAADLFFRIANGRMIVALTLTEQEFDHLNEVRKLILSPKVRGD